eukprot:g43591.t1
MIPFSDQNLITIDFKLPNSYFQSAKQAVGPQLEFKWKRKVDISPVAHSFPVAPAYLMNAPVDDLLTFFYNTYCPIIDTLAKKNIRKTTIKHPGFIHDYEIKQLKIKKNKPLRNLQNTATLQDRQTIKDKLKVINKTIQKRVKYAKNERQKKDLLQVNADIKRNPKKAWSILKRVEHVREGEVNTRFSFFTKLLLTTKVNRKGANREDCCAWPLLSLHAFWVKTWPEWKRDLEQKLWNIFDGDRYEGEFKDGQRNGQGVQTWPFGKRYEGEWKDDKRNGQGVMTLPDGQRYEGEWKDDKRNGQGVWTWPDGKL